MPGLAHPLIPPEHRTHMADLRKPSTAICAYTSDAIYVRDKSLVDELIGEVSFTQMMFFQIMARMPTTAEVKIVDAVLVTLMEHGITPSAIATRLTLMSAPESLPAEPPSSPGLCCSSARTPSSSCTCDSSLRALTPSPRR